MDIAKSTVVYTLPGMDSVLVRLLAVSGLSAITYTTTNGSPTCHPDDIRA